MRKELVYLEMPKVASGSVKKALKYKKAKCITHDIRNSNYLSLVEYMRVDAHKKFAFTFVRNPWDRLVSAFYYLNKGGIKPEDKYDFEKYLKKYEGDFTLFVHEGFKTDEIFEQMHFRPQFQWVTDDKGMQVTDFIGKYETLQVDFDYVLKKNWRFKKKLGVSKRGKHSYYKEVYTPETREIVAKAYGKDIELFNYVF
tara:strand:- start:423 stop:1016 length:594 start_codon:yes stop_codon:yes gene_type:complete